jgi:hypothetical protein
MGGMGQGESPALFESSLKSKYCLCEVAEIDAKGLRLSVLTTGLFRVKLRRNGMPELSAQ